MDLELIMIVLVLTAYGIFTVGVVVVLCISNYWFIIKKKE